MKEKLIALTAILLAFCVVVPSVSAEEQEEYDTGAMLSVFVLGIAVGASLKIIFDELTSDPKEDDTAELCREFEADYISDIINTNVSTAAAYSNTIADLVPFSKDHFIRQGELVSSCLWSPEVEYNVQEILEKASVRDNLTTLQMNVFDGFSGILKMISDRMSTWNSLEIYEGNMSVSFEYGENKISSSEMKGYYLPVANAYAGNNTVYLCSKEIWTDKAASIVREDGYVMQLEEGYNDLGLNFHAGVYTLQNNRVYASYMLPSLSSSSAPISSGLVMSYGDLSKIAYLNSSEYVIDNSLYDAVLMTVETKEGHAAQMNISEPLSVLDAFYKEMCKIQMAVSSSAAALWSIYDAAGESNAYVTTLSVPNYYEDIELSKAEKEIITLLALEQLAEYYQANEEIKSEGYKISKESLQLYCEGDIKDPLGNMLAEDVTFTPFFYSKNVTLFSSQENKVSQNGIAAVWSQSNADEASLVNLSEGCILNINKMVYGGLDVNSLVLKVSGIDLTVLPDYGLKDPSLPEDAPVSITGIICLIAGMIITSAGAYCKKYWIIAIGTLILLLGIWRLVF